MCVCVLIFLKSAFSMCLALVEVFGDFRRQIRIQRVELYHIDPWKHREFFQNSQKQQKVNEYEINEY